MNHHHIQVCKYCMDYCIEPLGLSGTFIGGYINFINDNAPSTALGSQGQL